MGRKIQSTLAVTILSTALVACGGGRAPAPEPPAVQAPAPASRPGPEPAREPVREPGPGVTSASLAKPPDSSNPAPVTKPAPPAAKAAVQDPGGPVEVAPSIAGGTRIGVEKCKMCHKIQYESWSPSAHAKRNPPLDCESCHGPGSEYKAIAVMKDPAKARAAGLVMPDKAFCTTCHKSGWTDAKMAAVHAHKPK